MSNKNVVFSRFRDSNDDKHYAFPGNLGLPSLVSLSAIIFAHKPARIGRQHTDG